MEYQAYVLWAQAFVEYASHAIVLNNEKQGNDVLSETKDKLVEQRQNLLDCQKLVADQGIRNFFIDQELDLKSRIDSYEYIAEEDRKQADDYQQTYANFEKKYFKGLQEVIDELKEGFAGEAGVAMDE